MKNRQKGLFLDLDGTLADSLPALRMAYDAFLQQFGKRGTDAEFQSLNGPPLTKICTLLRTTHDLLEPLYILEKSYTEKIEQFHAEIRPAVGAQSVLAHAVQRGWKIMVVTSSPQLMTEQWLDKWQLSTWIVGVVGGDADRPGKPAPDPYQYALTHCGCHTQHALAVEDSFQGAKAAIAAGLPTLFLGRTPPADLRQHPCFMGLLSTFADLITHL